MVSLVARVESRVTKGFHRPGNLSGVDNLIPWPEPNPAGSGVQEGSGSIRQAATWAGARSGFGVSCPLHDPGSRTPMNWLNYHHLYYFYVTVREGTVSAAARELRLSQPAVSAQIARLEKSVGLPLFVRKGRGMVLSDTGRMVHDYAQEIFSAGRELQEAIRQHRSGRQSRFSLGVADVLPKTFVYEFLRPLFDTPRDGLLVTVREGRTESLLEDLARQRFDIVLTDQALLPNLGLKVHTHVLGETSVTLLARRDLQRRYGKKFPQGLEGAPMLLPTQSSSLRREIDHWLETNEIYPRVVGEFEDSALLKLAGGRGAGIFPVPHAVEREICEQFDVIALGRIDTARVRFYLISAERRLRNPLVVELIRTARAGLLTEAGSISGKP